MRSILRISFLSMAALGCAEETSNRSPTEGNSATSGNFDGGVNANSNSQNVLLPNPLVLPPNVPSETSGYSTFLPSRDSVVVYVSESEGDDKNSGAFASPVRSLSKAKSMVRDGKPDQILLKQGDTWDEVFGSWTKSGRSTTEPLVIGSYGNGARPLIRTDGLNSDGISLNGGSTEEIRFLAIQGIHFTDNTHSGSEGSAGIRLQRTGGDILVEDCQIDKFKDGIVIGMEPPNPGVSNVHIRRNVIVDQWAIGQHSQGLYASGNTRGITIEGNVFDHNGWKEGVRGAEKTVFNHNMYINDGASGVRILKNISTRASLRGILSRGGGLIEGNVSVRNAQGIETWGDAIISDNVVQESGDIPNFPQGFGIQVVRNNGNVVIENNIVAHDVSNFTYNVFGIKVWHRLRKAIVRGNIVYDWRRPFFYSGPGGLEMTVENNQFQIDDAFHAVVVYDGLFSNSSRETFRNNKYWSPRRDPFWFGTSFLTFANWKRSTSDNSQVERLNYVDPERDLGSYNASIGGADSFEAFIQTARAMSRNTYDPRFAASPVIAHIRAGFSVRP